MGRVHQCSLPKERVHFPVFKDIPPDLCKKEVAMESTWPFFFFLKIEGRHLIIVQGFVETNKWKQGV